MATTRENRHIIPIALINFFAIQMVEIITRLLNEEYDNTLMGVHFDAHFKKRAFFSGMHA